MSPPKRRDHCHCSVCKSKKYSSRTDLVCERRAKERAKELLVEAGAKEGES